MLLLPTFLEEMRMSDFKQLEVWQKAHRATLEVYKITRSFPSEERFGLTSQIRRAAVSIGSNLAEGRGRKSDSDFGRFIQIALGSTYELQYQLLVARDIGYIAELTYEPLNASYEEIGRMLWSLLTRTKATSGSA
jgi:four helix bundle protein